MTGTVHAVLLLGLPLVTAALAIRSFSRPSLRRAIVAVIGGLATAVVSLMVGVHACRLGTPVTQWLIPSVCLSAGAMLIGHRRLRRMIVVASAVAAVALSAHYASVVHGPSYVGTSVPDPNYGVGAVRSEWHTWLTGLYRRVTVPDPVGRTPS